MKKQKNIRLDDSVLAVIEDISSTYKISDTEVISRAIWTLADVLFDGDSYENKISDLKSTLESIWR